jgi:endonuclease YncB( thermonuclease family)
MGNLIVQGTIDLTQFWPSGESDGDTAHVSVQSMTFEKKPTTVFDGAMIHGKGRPKSVIHNGAITVRWQGIDAPELHYDPVIKNGDNRNFRQPYGQSATVALSNEIKKLAGNKTTIACEVRTQVNRPNDVFDMYGRFIGTILIGDLSLNKWMVQRGHAFPTYYASMEPDEIRELQAAAADARGAQLGIWQGYTSNLEFDPDLVFQRHGAADENDRGDVLMPKIFRRLAACWASTGAISGFSAYLEQQKPDYCWQTDDFLQQGIAAAQPHKLTELIHGMRFTQDPGDLVFREGPSTIYDANGKPITGW